MRILYVHSCNNVEAMNLNFLFFSWNVNEQFGIKWLSSEYILSVLIRLRIENNLLGNLLSDVIMCF